MLDVILNWDKLVAIGMDAVVYLAMALIGTLAFLIRFALSMIFGVDADAGDLDIGGDFDHGSSFTLFSMLSMTAFFMGAGWMGLACRIDFGLGPLPSALSSAGFGFAMMILSSGLLYFANRLQHEVNYDMNTSVGRVGQAYVNIPPAGEGQGQVRVSISGRSMIVPAISNGEKIEAFTAVKVVEVRDDNTLIVEVAK